LTNNNRSAIEEYLNKNAKRNRKDPPWEKNGNKMENEASAGF
jgi:hypothetical protein